MEYRITNKKDSESYVMDFDNDCEPYHWIINNLELSKNWSVDGGEV